MKCIKLILFFQLLSVVLCDYCDVNCIKCIDKTKCQQCYEGLYRELSSDQKCVCQNGYKENERFVCVNQSPIISITFLGFCIIPIVCTITFFVVSQIKNPQYLWQSFQFKHQFVISIKKQSLSRRQTLNTTNISMLKSQQTFQDFSRRNTLLLNFQTQKNEKQDSSQKNQKAIDTMKNFLDTNMNENEKEKENNKIQIQPQIIQKDISSILVLESVEKSEDRENPQSPQKQKKNRQNNVQNDNKNKNDDIINTVLSKNSNINNDNNNCQNDDSNDDKNNNQSIEIDISIESSSVNSKRSNDSSGDDSSRSSDSQQSQSCEQSQQSEIDIENLESIEVEQKSAQQSQRKVSSGSCMNSGTKSQSCILTDNDLLSKQNTVVVINDEDFEFEQ